MKTNIYHQALLICWLYFFSVISYAQADFDHLDPEKIVPANLLQDALTYFDGHRSSITNQRYMVVIDYKQHNSKERFYLIDMQSGQVETYLSAHGKKSDPDFTGFATKFSNKVDSHKTSLGFFLTAETYMGENGYSLRLDGLSSSNSNARKRAIVIHGANYVTPGTKIGRSYGCPALEMRYHQDVIDRLKGGALLYAGF